MLIPGFGPEFAALHECRAADWQLAVEAALTDLQQKYKRTLVVGYSMGGGLSLYVAQRCRPSGLILLAPFWRVDGWFWASLPLLTRIFPRIKPFRLLRIDWLNTEARRGMANLLPDIDLEDPQARKVLGTMEFPTRVLIALKQVGLDAQRAVPGITSPVLVVQGVLDKTIQPAKTRELLRLLPGPSDYVELKAGHDLANPEAPAWAKLEREILDFAAQIAA